MPEEADATSQLKEKEEVVFTLFNPLINSISKISRTFLLTEHGDNENTNISIVTTAL
ncbi:hypothetical protein OWR28_18030 [Chryseobacterium sp. 1B4]